MFAIASACAFAAFSAPAAARTAETISYAERVSYADLDISTEQGAEQLLRRVNRAARDVCGRSHARLTLAAHHRQRQCVQRANDRAVARIANPTVYALYYDRTGRSPTGLAIALMNRS